MLDTGRCFHLNYELPLDLEQLLIKKGEPEFSRDEFLWVFDCFDYYRTETGKWKLFNFFSKLSRTDLIDRARAVSKLSSLLTRIQCNSLPSTSTF